MDEQTLTGYAVVELMGHNAIAGAISEVSIAGAAFLRVDVPALASQPAFTKFFGGSAIYAITPTDEATARQAAERLAIRPVSLWVVPDGRRELPAPTVEVDQGDPYREAWEHMDDEADEGGEEDPEYFIGSEIDRDKLSEVEVQICPHCGAEMGADHAEWCENYIPF